MRSPIKENTARLYRERKQEGKYLDVAGVPQNFQYLGPIATHIIEKT